MIEFLVKYWFLLVVAMVLLFLIGLKIYIFTKIPSKKQIETIKKWLLYAVIEAERELGSGTGKLKLRYVYDMFIVRFWHLSNVITFEMVSILVDGALDEMREMLTKNEAVSQYVGVKRGDKI